MDNTMQDIIETVRYLNRAFNHNAEVVFVDLANQTVNDRYASSFRRSGYPPSQVLKDADGNYGFVNPNYPNILFFTLDYFNSDVLTRCACEGELPVVPLFTCNFCSTVGPVVPRDVAQHEFFHSLQQRLKPGISKYEAEKYALWFEQSIDF